MIMTMMVMKRVIIIIMKMMMAVAICMLATALGKEVLQSLQGQGRRSEERDAA